jgi:predicted amidohydrolase
VNGDKDRAASCDGRESVGRDAAATGARTARVRVACVQLETRDDVAANVRTATALIEQAAAAGARLVALPETWAFRGRTKGILASAEPVDGPSTTALSRLAARLGVFVLAGSIYEPSPEPVHVYNTSVLIGPDGRLLAAYRKIHLFDAVSDTTVYKESGHLAPGSELVTVAVDLGRGGRVPQPAPVTLGLSICYDLRFPELYRSLALQGAEILFAPAAFTAFTGAAHWALLVRARAVENGCFVIAPDQVGEYLPGRACYGHSMIVDPWGEVLAEAPDGAGMCMADLDLGRVAEVRGQIPSLRNRRPDAYEL